MRVLKFIVEGQILTVDPECNLDGLVPGSEGYLKAEFAFSPEWNGYVKVATFNSAMGREYEPQILTDGKSCIIPTEALAKRIFKVGVVGKKKESKITTNKVAVRQNGGRV